jgi:hypothetical protein
MDEKDSEYIRQLIANADDAVNFYSEARKTERERSYCAAFLRFLGIGFRVNEVVSVKPDPPDVVFRHARLEICEILDPSRRRHDEWKTRAKDLRQVSNIDEVSIPIHGPRTLPYELVIDLVTKALMAKSKKYGSNCADLDALVYINILSVTLNAQSPLPMPTSLIAQGWRSVSFIMPPYSHVIYASASAPNFLVSFEGRTALIPNSPDRWFALVDEVF